METLNPTQKKALIQHLQSSINTIEDPVVASWSKEYFSKHESRYLHDLDLIAQHFNGGKILELGSLPCHMTYLLQQLNVPVIGADLNPNRCAQYIKQHQLEVIQCDIEQQAFPFKDGAFDLIILNETFEHLRINPLFTLREVRRTLSESGKLIITTPNLYSLKNVWRFLTGRGMGNPVKAFHKLETMGHMGHLREYSKREIRAFLTSCELDFVGHQFINYNPKPKGGIFTKFCYLIFRWLRPYQIFICVDKNSVKMSR